MVASLQELGMPKAVRAVGHANGANPLGIVVPCHRLIGADGSLVKYGGGLERKRWLLEHEGVALECGGSIEGRDDRRSRRQRSRLPDPAARHATGLLNGLGWLQVLINGVRHATEDRHRLDDRVDPVTRRPAFGQRAS